MFNCLKLAVQKYEHNDFINVLVFSKENVYILSEPIGFIS
jgi:hypothetical protein